MFLLHLFRNGIPLFHLCLWEFRPTLAGDARFVLLTHVGREDAFAQEI